MKLQKTTVFAFLLLAFTLCGAGAALADITGEVAAPALAELDSRPADVFGVSVVASGKDCSRNAADSAAAGNETEGLLCGTCSAPVCVGSAVESICGFSAGKFLRCQALSLCTPGDGTVRCRCSSGIIP